jgi:POT family proton-dependent oligopeptide transporter
LAKAATSNLDKFPPQIKFIVGNEGCERYSFYGMRAILTIFMVQYLLFEKGVATELMHIFMAACYLLPLLGSTLADRFLGRYRTILYLSLFYCAGHAVLSMFETKAGLYVGLSLIALGAGGIKPCISAFVGDQFKSDQKHLLTKVYNLFYFMINFGSMFSSILTPLTLKYYGPGVAFGIPGVLMAIATVIFWTGRKHYVKMPASGHDKDSVWAMLWTGTKGLGSGKGFMGAIKAKHPAVRIEEFDAAMNVAKIFAAVSVFWALFDQHASTWVLQAEKMQKHTTINIFGMTLFDGEILSSQMAALNPIFVLGLIPIFVYGIYPLAGKFFTVTPLRKMTAGMTFAALAYSTVAFIQYPMDAGQEVHILWQALPYLMMTMAEVMVSITGLEFAYTQAPKSLKSTIMSFWLLTIFIGNIITVVIVYVNFFPLGSGNYFMCFAFLMLLMAAVFGFIVRGYKMRDYMEK